MAAPAKRAKPEEFSSSYPELEKLKSWLSNEKIKADSKVSIVKDLCCAQYGMIAVEEIPADHKFLSIPRTSLLCPENCGIGDLLEREKKTLKSESRWVPLLLAILYEYLNPESRWRTYLDVCPDYSQLDHPMFWTDDDLKKELRGTGVIESVKQDLINIKKEFNEIVGPFIKNHQSVFPKEAHSIDLYKKLVGFVMGYSFTEPCQFKNEGKELVLPPPVMVPAADILNHVSQNNAKLDFGKDALDMITIKPIKKGDEIFNTYGELTNGQLLHMYGFSERSNNIYDAVEIPMDLFLEIFKEDISEEEKKMADIKWEFLEEMELVSPDGVFAVGPEGVLTEEELSHTLKVMFMTKSEFDEHKCKEGWTDDDDENTEDLSNEKLPQLPDKWKKLLVGMCEAKLDEYDSSLEDDENLMNDQNTLTRRQKWALYVRYGQKKLLQNMLNICKQ